MLAVVVTENLLIDITLKMKRLDSNVGSLKAALQERPEVLHAIHMDATTDVSLGFVNHIVNEAPLHSLVVGNRIVGLNGAAIFDVLENLILQSLAGDVWHNVSADLAKIPIKNALHDGLILEWAFTIDSQAALYVHVLGNSADESFICFDLATLSADLGVGAEPFAVQRQAKANAVHHEPCRLLGNANRAGNLIAADSILAIRQQPDSSEPLVSRDRRIFHDSASLRGELALWMYALALPLALILEEYNVNAATGRASHNTIGPAKPDHVGQNVVGIAEIADSLLQGLWLLVVAVHARKIANLC